MQDHPSIRELIESVKRFLETTARPHLSDHDAFQARIASNVLAIVLREIEYGKPAMREESARLAALLNAAPGTPLEALNAKLVAAIRAGEMNLGTPGLLAHLKATAADQLAIDQPTYEVIRPAEDD